MRMSGMSQGRSVARLLYQVNNPVTFCRKPMGSEEFLNQMVKTLGITVDRRLQGRPRKMES